MRPSPLSLWSLFALTGCGDSLVSGRNLEDLISTRPPGSAAWELRWATGEGLAVECPRAVGDALTVVVGQIDVRLPAIDVEQPPGWFELEASRYAVLLPALVDLDAYEPPEEDDEPDGVEGAERGVWGISAPVAVVVATGDLAEVSRTLTLDGADTLAFDDGVAWARVIPEIVDVRGSLSEGLTPVDDDVAAGLSADGVPVTALSFARDEAAGVWAGELFDHVTTVGDCGEFEREDDE